VELEEARQIVTAMCQRIEDYAAVDEDTWERLAETERPVGGSNMANGIRVGLSITPPDWDARIRAILAAPIEGAELELAEALTVVWRAEDAQGRVPDDLVREVERITGERVFPD
jgi:hypothetical protein